MDALREKKPFRAGIAWMVLAAGFALALTGVPVNKTNAAVERRPVLVELFTSEGCSSCPPADELLKKLDRAQPVASAQIIVLSEHVDYWDDLGWRDPYSSHAYSERQDAYASRFGLNTVYTPQMVVDGRFETVGSDERRAIQEIEDAARTEKTAVGLSVETHGKGIQMQISVGALPAAADSDAADVMLAFADERDESSVRGGENGGRTLVHVAVLRRMERIGVVGKKHGSSFNKSVSEGQPDSGALRAVVIVQSGAGRVWGVASEQLEAR